MRDCLSGLRWCDASTTGVRSMTRVIAVNYTTCVIEESASHVKLTQTLTTWPTHLSYDAAQTAKTDAQWRVSLGRTNQQMLMSGFSAEAELILYKFSASDGKIVLSSCCNLNCCIWNSFEEHEVYYFRRSDVTLALFWQPASCWRNINRIDL